MPTGSVTISGSVGSQAPGDILTVNTVVSSTNSQGFATAVALTTVPVSLFSTAGPFGSSNSVGLIIQPATGNATLFAMTGTSSGTSTSGAIFLHPSNASFVALPPFTGGNGATSAMVWLFCTTVGGTIGGVGVVVV